MPGLLVGGGRRDNKGRSVIYRPRYSDVSTEGTPLAFLCSSRSPLDASSFGFSTFGLHSCLLGLGSDDQLSRQLPRRTQGHVSPAPRTREGVAQHCVFHGNRRTPACCSGYYHPPARVPFPDLRRGLALRLTSRIITQSSSIDEPDARRNLSEGLGTEQISFFDDSGWL